MALDDKLDCAYVAKNVAWYLNLKTSYVKTLLHRIGLLNSWGLADPITGEPYKDMRERLYERRKGIEGICASLGLSTENEIAAYRFTTFTKCFLPFDRKDTWCKDEFEDALLYSLELGLESLKAEYIATKSEHIKTNKDLISKTYIWLLNKVHSRIDNGEKVELLNVTELSMEGDYIKARTIIPRARWSNPPVTTKWTKK